MQKILFIDTRSNGDWGLDLLFSGLVRNLGPDKIVEFPFQEKHLPRLPVLLGDPEGDWGAERRSLSYYDGHPSPRYSSEEVRKMVLSGEISHVFMGEKPGDVSQYLRSAASIAKTPVIVVSGLDTFQNDSPQQLARLIGEPLKKMFLINWKKEYELLPYASKYSWSTNFDHLWDVSDRQKLLSDKVYDICFMGYNSNRDRVRFVDHILRRWGHLRNHIVLERRPNTFDMFVLKREYFKTIAQSRICVNLNGAADDGRAMRFYEIPYVGSFMLSQRFAGMFNTPFLNGEHCRYFSDENEFDVVIADALENSQKREKIALEGHLLAIGQESVKVRVGRMLEEIGIG
jgi:hypothetical protein